MCLILGIGSAHSLGSKANEVIRQTGASNVPRVASFLLLADSRIEGEKPRRNRLERWGRAVLQAGKNPLTLDEIVRLHIVLIEGTRFTQPGLRRDGVFLGERDPDGEPSPEFIGARPQGLESLVQVRSPRTSGCEREHLIRCSRRRRPPSVLSTSIRCRMAMGVSSAALFITFWPKQSSRHRAWCSGFIVHA
jgi:GAF domain-containing protein